MVVLPSFPLFNLPFVPLNAAISYMCPLDLLSLSKLSKKTKNVVKRNQKFNLEVNKEQRIGSHQMLFKSQDGSTLLKISIKNKVYIFSQNNCIYQEIDGLIVQMDVENNSITTFCKDVIKGYQAMTSFLCNVFRIPSIRFYFKNNSNISKIVEYIQNVKRESKNNISEIVITYIFLGEIYYREILDKFMDVPELNIRSAFLTYKHNDVQSTRYNCYCHINEANWFKLKDMNLLIKCKNIRLWFLQWSTQEMNQFLKEWMEDSIMEEVELAVEKIDFQMAIEGLLVTPKRKNLVFQLTGNGGMKDCFEIQRKDGIKANLWRDGDTFVMQTFK